MRQPRQASLTLRSAAVVALLPALPHAGSVLSVAVEVVIGAALALAAVGVTYLCLVLWRDRVPLVSHAEANALATEARRRLEQRAARDPDVTEPRGRPPRSSTTTRP
jgi:ABC-type transport system involved in cytochrome bd biosynthesis fused ATPase/permease subunit